MRNRLKAFAALPLLASSLVVHAAEWQLFSKGQPTANYDQIIIQVKAGDTVTFSNGKSFTLIQHLNDGEHNRVFAISQTQVIRLELHGYSQGEKAMSSLYDYKYGRRQLADAGIRVPALYESESLIPEYMIVERLRIHFTMREMGDLWRDQGVLPTVEQLQKLEEFARTTWQLKAIGDFHCGQLGWTGSEWVLFDFNSGQETACWPGDESDFSRRADFLEAKHNAQYPLVQLLRMMQQALYQSRIRNMDRDKLTEEVFGLTCDALLMGKAPAPTGQPAQP